MPKDKTSLTEKMKKLDDITQWFETSESRDIEESLKKLEIAATLFTDVRTKLKEAENKFKDIKLAFGELEELE